jgi:hypothetical protein
VPDAAQRLQHITAFLRKTLRYIHKLAPSVHLILPTR